MSATTENWINWFATEKENIMAKATVTFVIDNLPFGDYRFHGQLKSGDDLNLLIDKTVVITVPGAAPQPTLIEEPVVQIN